jgi:hypothetical protein
LAGECGLRQKGTFLVCLLYQLAYQQEQALCVQLVLGFIVGGE